MKNWTIITLFICIVGSHQQQQTPVIGGSCNVGAADIQIGGKKTQFYLKCEPKDGANNGKGTWVVKSRAKELNQQKENLKSILQKQTLNTHHTICEIDLSSAENLPCSTSETCLQSVYQEPMAYLQCDSSLHMWIKKYCQPGLMFSFEQQLCVGQKRHVARQAVSGGILCTYSGCSNSNPCNIGSCNNGYCCSQQSSPSILVSSSSNGCNNCNNNNNGYSAISICPNGGVPYGSCNQGSCSSGFTCTSQNICCPSTGLTSTIYTCPSGTQNSGACYNGACASGCQCVQNTCCCQKSIFCPDGTQAAGACVNFQCGIGFTCVNGLCCTSTSQTPKCLDGTAAIGACINCKCGTGYTCTTGNLCCPATTNICPTGQTAIGPCVNGICPAGYTCTGTAPNQLCCGTATALCLQIDTSGPCISGTCATGFTCDFVLDPVNGECCPNLNLNLGPCIQPGSQCPTGAYCLQSQQNCFSLIGVAVTAATNPCTGLVAGSAIGPCNPDNSCQSPALCLPDPNDFPNQACICPDTTG